MKVQASALILLFIAFSAAATEGYYTSPALLGDNVVFTAEGDLWAHRLGSSQATRLTTHPAFESGASISPDGKQIAFVANYEGASEVYAMPMSGGVPKRLTYENAAVSVQGWTSNARVLYSTDSRAYAPYNWTLKTVDSGSLKVETIPLADAIDGAIDSDSNNIYFTQFGLPWSGDNAVIYRGGMLGKLWQYRLGSDDEASMLGNDHAGSARSPMVDGDKLYFLSDASGRDNLWSMNLDGSGIAQLTHHDDFSIRSASVDSGRAVYQLGADIYLRDLSGTESIKLDIRITSDHPSLRESWIKDPLKYATSARFAGTGEKAAITARGKVAIAGIDQVRLVTVGTSPRTRLRRAALSRDGNWVYAISDAKGELEIWRYDAKGTSSGEQLTEGGNTLRTDFVESPNGKWIAHGDGRGGLWLLNIETKKNTKIVVDSDTGHQFVDIKWSPDSNLIAVSHRGKNDARPRILLHAVDDGTLSYLTSDKYESWGPTFSQDGKWLYVLSNRNISSPSGSVWADRDFGPLFDRRTGIFAYSLTIDAEFPFDIPNELTAAAADEKDEDDSDRDESEIAKVDVAWDGIANRIWQVPIEPGNYTTVAINDTILYVLSQPVDQGDGGEITALKLEPNPQPAAFTDSATAMDLSDDGSKIFVVKTAGELPEMYIVPAEAEFPEDVSKNTLQVQEWQFNIDPKLEWEQMFHDAWLMHRQQFFDPNMRGVDWTAMKDKYAPLVTRVTDRRELNDILGQMMGELNALHSGVRGGDVPSDPDAPSAAVLGAELTQTSNGVQITHIYRHDPEVPGAAPPLARPGVNAAELDTIETVNGIDVVTLEDVHRVLRNQGGKQVLLQLKRGRAVHQTVVVPIDSRQARSHRYADWVANNRDKVEAADSSLGYLHLEAMGSGDVSSFARDFYASDSKAGMVIDVRRNGGGNVDSWIIDRLIRKAWMFWSYRSGKPGTNMQNTFRGHLVVIADQGTYSDGETFTAAIKALDIAPVIGKRTAGAGVWLSGRNSLSDFGIARVAEFPVYDMSGEWIVEGYGVSPTIEVDNLPHATYEGEDAQLDAAIAYLRRKLKEEPIPEMKAKPFPDYGQPAQDVE